MKTLHLTVRTTLISIRRGIALVVDVGGLANVTKCNKISIELTEHASRIKIVILFAYLGMFFARNGVGNIAGAEISLLSGNPTSY